MSSNPHAPKAEWVQVIREVNTNKILAENNPGNHLHKLDIAKKFGMGVTFSMRKV